MNNTLTIVGGRSAITRVSESHPDTTNGTLERVHRIERVLGEPRRSDGSIRLVLPNGSVIPSIERPDRTAETRRR